MRKNFITVEMNDGTVHGPERVIFADKMRLERTGRASNWDLARDEVRMQSFLAWAALDRTKAIQDLGYEQFLEAVVDIEFKSEAGDESPTPADTSA